jgi:hypothetical protein
VEFVIIRLFDKKIYIVMKLFVKRRNNIEEKINGRREKE